MARAASPRSMFAFTALGWFAGLLVFFPILWTFLTSFKSEGDAVASPPLLFFHWTLENYTEVQSRSDYFLHFGNSVVIAFGSTLLGLAIAIPAAWAMAFAPTPRTKDVLMWMLSTKMMPPVGVLVPIYLVFRDWGLLDTRLGLTGLMTLVDLPLIVWMLYTYFKEIPDDILEAARMDGAPLAKEIIYVLAPMAVPGIASTLLLNVILAWNEAFWTLNLSAANAAPLTAFIASYSSPEGLFWAKLSAASTLAIAPILVLGWFSQKRLVRGLTFGAVKAEETLMGQITLEGVRKQFGELAVIPDIDLDIADGEFVVFVGPSSCGKSTLLRLIAGLEDVTSGHIRIDGVEVTSLAPAKRGLAMVFQSYALYPHMTVRGNIAFPLKMAGEDRETIERKVRQAAEVLNLTPYLDRKPRMLSGGQRQRVAIGRAIVRAPKAFLFDEPLSKPRCRVAL